MADLPARLHALWRAVTYVSVAQLHLNANPLLTRPLEAADMKHRPSGHWGTVPGTAWFLAHVTSAAADRLDQEIVPIIGAGHAGVAQLSLAWLTGDLAKVRPEFSRDAAGFAALVASFPDVAGLGSEVSPLLPAGVYSGGWLGGALAFAQGASLEAPYRVVVPLLGDGECETPTTAAAWLAQRALPDARVLPIVHLNGYRMGGHSLLEDLSDEQLRAYALGLGWDPVIAHVAIGRPSEHTAFHRSLRMGIDAVHHGRRRVIFLRCVKGWTGPVAAHKTPLTELAENSHQRLLLQRWMSSYRPSELFDPDGQPTGALTDALDRVRVCALPPVELTRPPTATPRADSFGVAVTEVLRQFAAAGDFKVFSPDELASNRLPDIVSEPWVHEVLAEEVLLGWLAGWTASGRRGVLVSYEAFAPLLLTGLIGHLKQRRQTDPTLPSLNLLLTSYGWHNAYTHGDPSAITALLATGDPAVHVFTPADAHRTAVVIDDALRSTGRLNIIIAGKHATPAHPLDTLAEERAQGLAVWPHLSDPGRPDLAIVCSGDIPASVVRVAVDQIRKVHRCRLRVIDIHDLAALTTPVLDRHIDPQTPVLAVTLGHPAAILGLLTGRPSRPIEVIGWREPPHPMPATELATYAGMDVDGVVRAAASLIGQLEERP
jgi:xylulose-5-phosphate/fructose-6-phosphate phosphoketolase